MARRAARPEPAPISAIVTCKGRLAHLKQSLPTLMAQPFAEVIVVDYDCPERAGDWVEAAFRRVEVVRATGRRIFNVSKARNLGAAAATSPWLLFVDADVSLLAGFCESLGSRLGPGRYFMVEPSSPDVTGTMLVSREDFDAVGGYDEAFEGWGCEDVELRDRLDAHGDARLPLDARLVQVIAHADEVRTRYHELRAALTSGLINDVYRRMKADLRSLGVSLDEPARRALYAQLRAGVVDGHPAQTYEVAFRATATFGLTLSASLKYQIADPRAQRHG